ncbi:MAG: MarR family transcriptional regulator [Hyphomicrobiaceae bacterium]
MTDITSAPISDADLRRETAAGLAPRIVELIELLFFAYRDFTAGPDKILAEFGFGRAHHRVLHFVNRYPGLRVADLLDILKITKQSLARVLKQLVEQGYIEQRAGTSDRRERLLFTTDKGAQLAERLMEPQKQRIGKAIELAGQGGADTMARLMLALIDRGEQAAVEALIHREDSGAKGKTET